LWNVSAAKRRLGSFVLGAAFAVSIGSADPAVASKLVSFDSSGYASGTILVRNSERRLYYIIGHGRAIRYTVGLGRPGKEWVGTTYIRGKHLQPAWSPPAVVRRDNPRLADVIPGGSPANPMGAAALTLARGELAIHGTNKPGSIGGYVSYGCVRMYNDEIMDLFGRVSVGTRVVAVP
jgi:lipoprotein-anchoring transpeptidase ErfK/SrfK